MIKFHLDFDMNRFAVMSFACTKHSICIVMKCIYVSAPNTRCWFFPHDMHPARVRSDTIQYDTISSQDDMLSCHLSARNTRCFFTICIYVSSPKTQCLLVPPDMHPARVRVNTIRYDTIHLETIYCHVICLHETLDMYGKCIYVSALNT